MVVIKAEVLGTKEIIRALKILPVAAQKRIFRSVMPKAGRLAQKAGKRTAPKSSGILSKSLGTRAFTNNATGEVGATVGPRSKIGRYVAVESTRKGKRFKLATSAAGTRALGKAGTRLIFRRPVRYAHVLEFGRKSSARGGATEATHWLEKAHKSTRQKQVTSISQGIVVAVERETRKLAATTKK